MDKRLQTEASINSTITEKMGPAHVNRLNTISKLKKEGYNGPDASLDISLFEYGIAWKTIDEQILFIYQIQAGDGRDKVAKFERVFFNATLNVYHEFNWIKSEDWNTFYNSFGTSKELWDELPLPMKIYDLFNQFGYENIFGSSYWEGFEIKEDEDDFISDAGVGKYKNLPE